MKLCTLQWIYLVKSQSLPFFIPSLMLEFLTGHIWIFKFKSNLIGCKHSMVFFPAFFPHCSILSSAPELPILERRNWLIHQHYLRKDYDTCKVEHLPLGIQPITWMMRRSWTSVSPSLHLTRAWPANFQHAASGKFTGSLNRSCTYGMFCWNIHVSFLFEDFELSGLECKSMD